MSDEIRASIVIVFFVLLMALIPPFSQFKSGVNNGAFRQIRVKKFAFMFRAPDGISVSKEGVALPLFILQVVGYVIAVLSIILNILLIVLLQEAIVTMLIATLAIFTAEVIGVIVTIVVLTKISHVKKKDKNNN